MPTLDKQHTARLRHTALVALASLGPNVGHAEQFATILADVMLEHQEHGHAYLNMNTPSAALARALAVTFALTKKEAHWETPTIKAVCKALHVKFGQKTIADWLVSDGRVSRLAELLADLQIARAAQAAGTSLEPAQ